MTRIFPTPEHVFYPLMHLFPNGIPVKDETEYQMPQYHGSWGRIKWIVDQIKWGHFDRLFTDPDKLDPPFYILDTAELSYEQYQALGKVYRQVWAKCPMLVNCPDFLKLVTIPVEFVDIEVSGRTAAN